MEKKKQQVCWTIISLNSPQMLGRRKFEKTWFDAIKILSDEELYSLFDILMGVMVTNRNDDWEPQVIAKMQLSPVQIKAQLIPIIRRISEKGSSADAFDGTGIIDRLARLQNPAVHSQHEKERFNEITNFLRDVVDRPDAVEIPYERNTILVHMDGRVLPIESLGTGIHEMVILAAAATVLSEHTSNQYFITIHSAVLMDVPAAEIYQYQIDKRLFCC